MSDQQDADELAAELATIWPPGPPPAPPPVRWIGEGEIWKQYEVILFDRPKWRRQIFDMATGGRIPARFQSPQGWRDAGPADFLVLSTADADLSVPRWRFSEEAVRACFGLTNRDRQQGYAPAIAAREIAETEAAAALAIAAKALARQQATDDKEKAKKRPTAQAFVTARRGDAERALRDGGQVANTTTLPPTLRAMFIAEHGEDTQTPTLAAFRRAYFRR